MRAKAGKVYNTVLSATVLLLFTVAALILSGCIIRTTHYFDAPEEVRTAQGTISYFIDDVDYILRSLADTSITSDPSYRAWIERITPRYGEVEYDPGLSYWKVEVVYRKSRGPGCPGLVMQPDSIVITFDSGYTIDQAVLLDPITKQVEETCTWVLYLEPIPIPPDYRGNFSVSFDLTIRDTCVLEPIEQLPVTIECVHKKKRWTPLFPGQP